MFETGNLVTLKTAEQYDNETLLTPEDIGEIVSQNGGEYSVAFEGHTDVNGITPILIVRAHHLTMYQI